MTHCPILQIIHAKDIIAVVETAEVVLSVEKNRLSNKLGSVFPSLERVLTNYRSVRPILSSSVSTVE
jgi:hypothetical protein